MTQAQGDQLRILAGPNARIPEMLPLHRAVAADTETQQRRTSRFVSFPPLSP
jgi:hypothetical protein